MSYLPVPTEGWPQRRAPDNITDLGGPASGCTDGCVATLGTAVGEQAITPRIVEPHVVNSALRTLPLDPYGAGDTDEALYQLPSGPSLEECGVWDMYQQLSFA